jgi:hypothetical protein
MICDDDTTPTAAAIIFKQQQRQREAGNMNTINRAIVGSKLSEVGTQLLSNTLKGFNMLRHCMSFASHLPNWA